MHMKRTLIVLIAILALGALAVWLFSDKERLAIAAATPVGSVAAATSSVSSSAAGKKPAHRIDWIFTALPDDPAAGTPMTKVSLAIDGGASRIIGSYAGSCTTIIGSSWQLQQNETSGAICYFAGGGNEIGVFVNPDDSTLSVQQGDIDEGSAETPSTRGNFRELFKVTP
jgi:hypothetical protein